MTRRDLGALLVSLALLLGAGWVLGYVVTDVLGSSLVAEVDRPVTEWIQDARSSGMNGFMRGATRLGAGSVLAALTILFAGAVYLVTRSLGWPVFILMSGLGGPLLDKTLKPLVGRPRPQLDPLIEIGGNSFPSGHATGITALWLALALFALLYWRWRPLYVWPAVLAVIVLVDLTRPYLGVHWPTDVLFGSILSVGWVLICLRFTEKARLAPGSPQE